MALVALSLVGVVVLAGAARVGYHRWQTLHPAGPAPLPRNAVVIQSTPTPTETAVPSTATPTAPPTPEPLRPITVLAVPYTGQAPTGNWDAVHEDYCEAAAVLMVGYWYQKRYIGSDVQTIPPGEAEQKMAEITRWERANFPGHDLDLNQVASVASNFYNLDGQVVPVGPDDSDAIRRQIAAGKPVIIPVMTQLLDGQKINPQYTYHRGAQGGYGVYHVMVLIGYDVNTGEFYADDAGIVPQGKRVSYPWSRLSAAIDAQTVSSDTAVRQGRLMLVLSPRQ